MKKLMVAAAVAVLGIAANAANVQWGLAEGESLTDISAGNMYLIYNEEAEVNFNTALAGMASFDIDDVMTKIGGTWKDSAEFTGGGSLATTLIKTTTPIDDLGSGTHDFYVVVINEEGKNLAYATISPTINNGTTSQPNMSLASDFGYVAAAVPEPTSGLLLLLGVAGLALRRRRA